MSVDGLPARRFGARLSPDGTWAAAPVQDGDRISLELWCEGPDGMAPHPTDLSVDPGDLLLPVRDLLYICASRGRTHMVWSADRHGARTEVAQLTGHTARIIGPAADDRDPRPWSLLFDGTRTALARVPGDTVLELDGVYHGGTWLSVRRLALGHLDDRGSVSTVQVDTATSVVTPLFHVTDRSNDRVQAYAPATDLVVVGTDAGGIDRLGYAHSDRRWTFPSELATPDGLINALAVDPTGQSILAHVRHGVRSLLRVFDVATQTARELVTPPGSLAGTASWTPSRLVVPWTDPGVPLEFLHYGPDLVPHTTATQTAPIVTVPGADAPIEAIAYGGADWLLKPRLVVALHGGPLDAWRLAYDPLLSRIADVGDTAVLAINQRGSIGYGHAFAAAIRSGWGSADLEDVLAVGRYLAAVRGSTDGLSLLGVSYGGFLALLAACVEPNLWHGCAALSTFSSPARLAACASPAVKAGVVHAGGLNGAVRDLVELAPHARARVLLVHGTCDETVPVTQARELAEAFGPHARYVEIPQTGHVVSSPRVWDLVSDFLTQPSPPLDQTVTSVW